jgi:DNA-binding NarL/FixJ family response regulator
VQILGNAIGPGTRFADLVAFGWTNREIAAQPYLSVKTVESHLGNIHL